LPNPNRTFAGLAANFRDECVICCHDAMLMRVKIDCG
jgi:hypothetical protein